MQIHIHIYIYVCMYVCLYISIYNCTVKPLMKPPELFVVMAIPEMKGAISAWEGRTNSNNLKEGGVVIVNNTLQKLKHQNML